MPSILFYALASDLRTIADRLNEDPEIAYVIGDGPRRWRTVDRMAISAAADHALWHRPSGPLPVVGSSEAEPDTPILDPDVGWEERLSSAVPGHPFFGSVPNVFWLHISISQAGLVPMNAFGWIGNRYRGIGGGATPAADKWWKRLQRWIRSETTLVPRGGMQGSGPGEVAAFPAAFARIQSGVPGELNPPAG